jgi:hypothetical protein
MTIPKKTDNTKPTSRPGTANDSALKRKPSLEQHRILGEEIKESNTVKNSMPAPPNPNRK